MFIATMDFDPHEPLVAQLLSAMNEATARGANVTFLADAHNFLADERGIPGPLFYRLSLDNFRGGYADRLAALRALESAGGRFRITNVPKRRFNPRPIGRSNLKAAVVGGTAYIGGCNLERPWQVDVMTAWEHKGVAAVLSDWLERMYESGSARTAFNGADTLAKINETTSLLCDAGTPGQSLIYDQALRLIDNARQSLLMTCQYLPSGQIAKHLAAAEARGIKVEIIYSHPRAHGAAAYLQYMHQIAQQTRRLPASIRAGRLDRGLPKLHAKLLISEHEALIGSHNYVAYGVRFGTAELALHSTDKQFGDHLRRFIKQQIANLR